MFQPIYSPDHTLHLSTVLFIVFTVVLTDVSQDTSPFCQDIVRVLVQISSKDLSSESLLEEMQRPSVSAEERKQS